MTTMITAVYDAPVSAGADDAKARRAAKVLADYDSKFASPERRFDGLERRIEVFEARVDGRLAAVETKFDGKFNLLAWMLGILIAAVSALVIHSFFA